MLKRLRTVALQPLVLSLYAESISKLGLSLYLLFSTLSL
jgi:hypothetical protein